MFQTMRGVAGGWGWLPYINIMSTGMGLASIPNGDVDGLPPPKACGLAASPRCYYPWTASSHDGRMRGRGAHRWIIGAPYARNGSLRTQLATGSTNNDDYAVTVDRHSAGNRGRQRSTTMRTPKQNEPDAAGWRC